ncbi:MAG: lipopolysaccharide assembly LapA domain-containing protein [Anaerolineales bacterium]|jgi:putative membrane protein
MQILLIFSFIIAFLAIIFAIQNTGVTSIRFLIWESEGSLALILFIAMAAGALISYLVTAPNQIKGRMTISNQRKRIAEVESQLSSTQEELQKTQAQLHDMEMPQTDKEPPVEPGDVPTAGPDEEPAV